MCTKYVQIGMVCYVIILFMYFKIFFNHEIEIADKRNDMSNETVHYTYSLNKILAFKRYGQHK